MSESYRVCESTLGLMVVPAVMVHCYSKLLRITEDDEILFSVICRLAINIMFYLFRPMVITEFRGECLQRFERIYAKAICLAAFCFEIKALAEELMPLLNRGDLALAGRTWTVDEQDSMLVALAMIALSFKSVQTGIKRVLSGKYLGDAIYGLTALSVMTAVAGLINVEG